MAFFKRAKRHPDDEADSDIDPVLGTSTGLVSSVLTRRSNSDEPSRFDGIVERQYGPGSKQWLNSGSKINRADGDPDVSGEGAAVAAPEDLATDFELESSIIGSADRDLLPILEIDPIPRVGFSTIITGKIVADEDLEIHGTVEGSITLHRHQLMVGIEGIVKAEVEANSVLVIGRITGNVTATDVVEVKSGGYIGGDVIAPRIIMADGAIVIGALDMTAAFPKDLERHGPPTQPPTSAVLERPPLSGPISDEGN